MKRRSFLKTSSVVSLPLLLNGMPISAYSRSRLFNFLNTETDKVLVLIQLNGGNDGLNTILPLDQYDNLANVRSNIIIPEGSALPIDDVTAFHPNMTGLRDLYLDGKMEIVQSVGYPNQNRSHFRSTDIWTSGSPADEAWNTGWLGRWMDGDHPTFPDAYPNPDFPDPLALTVGSLVSTTCQGSAANFSLAIEDPFSLSQLATGERIRYLLHLTEKNFSSFVPVSPNPMLIRTSLWMPLMPVVTLLPIRIIIDWLNN
jgi:uncharacterized protein (DUF1501 family)